MIKLTDCISVADELGLDPKVILAVANVESRGDLNAFLYEPHVFSRLTMHRFDEGYPEISYPVWDRNRYPKTKLARQIQFDKACQIEPLKAFESASWGLFQIMGFNYMYCGYVSALVMSTDLRAGIPQNVTALGKIIRTMRLVETLKAKEWDKFARVYNGPGYKLNHYHLKLANAFEDLSDLRLA